MWIFTRDGFYSAVKDPYCGEGEIMVRARAKEDIVKLARKCAKKKSDVISTPNADYAYRLKMKQAEWVKYVATTAEAIDYANVKAAISGHGSRHDAYYDCWSALRRLQEETCRKSGSR